MNRLKNLYHTTSRNRILAEKTTGKRVKLQMWTRKMEREKYCELIWCSNKTWFISWSLIQNHFSHKIHTRGIVWVLKWMGPHVIVDSKSFSTQNAQVGYLLIQRQQKRDRHRLQLESRNTPHRSIETSKTWTRLTKRLENEHILNICKGGGAESGAGGGGAAGKTVLYCNQTKTIMHPQLLQSPLSSFSPVTSSSSGTSDSRWQAGCSNCLKNMQSLPCLSLQAPTWIHCAIVAEMQIPYYSN